MHDPSGAMVKVVLEVTSAISLPYWSRPVAVYCSLSLPTTVAMSGLSRRWSSGPGVNVTDTSATPTPFTSA